MKRSESDIEDLVGILIDVSIKRMLLKEDILWLPRLPTVDKLVDTGAVLPPPVGKFLMALASSLLSPDKD